MTTPPVPAFEVDGLPVFVEGEGQDAVVMIHGWPDTCRLWDAQVPDLAPRFRCVRFTLPGFDTASRSAPASLARVLDLIDHIADAVSLTRPVILLLHDWGCGFGYHWALAHPSRVQRLIGVDIGDAGSPAHLKSLTLTDKALIAAYQLWLAAAWRIGGRRGDAMTRRMARLAGAPGEPAAIGHAMDHPYYLLWSGAYAGMQRSLRHFEPPCPMLYLYGRRKPFQFHSPSWAARLAAQPGHRVVGMDAGHWPMLEKTAEFNRAVLSWLSDRDGPTP